MLGFPSTSHDPGGRRLPFLHHTLRVVGVLFPALTLLASALAPFNIGSYTINGQHVTGPEFIARGGLLVFWAVSIAAASLAYGIHRGRKWTRPALMGFLVTVLVAVTIYTALRPSPEDLASCATTAVATLCAWWYLYRKASVRQYYSSLSPAIAPRAT
jgi:hypothetical protein